MLRRLFQTSLFAAVFIACGAPEPAPAPDPEPEGSPEAEVPARTADPFQRGLTEADFPRVQELAPGVYSYEQLRAAGEELFTTVSMFVVTDEGVLVADGQGSFEETARMVEEIGKITDQPITHVVIASDHGDHTAGNAAFPEGVEFIVHENSVAAMAGIRERIPEIPMPQTVISDRLDLTLGGRAMEVLFLGRAHTGGDLTVHLAGGERAVPHRGLSPPGVPGDAFGVSDRVGGHAAAGRGAERPGEHSGARLRGQPGDAPGGTGSRHRGRWRR